MEFINLIMPVIWRIVDKKRKYRVNISTIDNKLTVSILLGRRIKRFSHTEGAILLEQLQAYTLMC